MTRNSAKAAMRHDGRGLTRKNADVRFRRADAARSQRMSVCFAPTDLRHYPASKSKMPETTTELSPWP